MSGVAPTPTSQKSVFHLLLLSRRAVAQLSKVMYQHYRKLIPTLLLTICCITTLVTAVRGVVVMDGTAYDFTLTAVHYAAFVATLTTLLSFFLLRKYYNYFLAITLILGVVGLLHFTPTQTTAGIGFGDITIGVNPLSLLVSSVFYALNFQTINSYFLAFTKPPAEKTIRVQQQEIELFKSRFSRKSTQELTQIVVANKLVPTALAAARQLLQERQ